MRVHALYAVCVYILYTYVCETHTHTHTHMHTHTHTPHTVNYAAAAYTYYTSLCLDEAQKRKGNYVRRGKQHRHRERVIRVSVI